MVQAKFSLEEDHINFINRYKEYGFKDKSTLIRLAIDRLIKEIELKELKKSADLYAELYEEDSEIKELTESSLSGWPE